MSARIATIQRCFFLLSLLLVDLWMCPPAQAQPDLPSTLEHLSSQTEFQISDNTGGLVGRWSGELLTTEKLVMAWLTLSPDGTYFGSISVTKIQNGHLIPQQDNHSAGSWKAERGELVLSSSQRAWNSGSAEADRSRSGVIDAKSSSKLTHRDVATVDDCAIRIQNGQLTLQEKTPGGWEIRLSRIGITETANEPVNRLQLDHVIVPNPAVGIWWASETLPAGECCFRADIQSTGTYQFSFQLQTADGIQESASVGRWNVQGNTMRFESRQGIEVVPFKDHGEILILDFSRANGYVIILSKQQRSGGIRLIPSPGFSPEMPIPQFDRDEYEPDGPFRSNPSSSVLDDPAR